jgi:8-oxo-dGTP pyrophosphatase MutT (NUDIX family)
MSDERRLRPAAKAVIVSDGRVLVTRNRTPGDPGPDWLIFPGGGQRPGETLDRTLVREVREETGFEVLPGRLLWVREHNVIPDPAWPFDPRDHLLELMFAAEVVADHGDAHEEDQYQLGVEWLTPDELAELRFYPEAVVPRLRAHVVGDVVAAEYLGAVE